MSPPWPITVVARNPVSCGAVLWRMGGAHRLSVLVKASFGVVHEGPARLIPPRDLVREDHARDPATGLLDEAAELAPYLPCAGVVLTGHAHAPAGRPTPGMVVRLALYREGPLLDKTLHVFGFRAPAGNAAPQPFQKIPLGYDRAHGGPGFDDNPAGTGARARPNVIDPADPLRPAGFGPVARGWGPRRRLLGNADPPSLAQPVLELPDGFDFRWFQAAPADQQLEYLHGDEWVVMDGMHPALGRVQTRLPSARAEARWYPVGAAGAGPGRGVDLSADTLVIDTDRQILSVIWRGHFLVEPDGLARLRIYAGLDLPGYPTLWPDPAEVAPAPKDAGGDDQTIRLPLKTSLKSFTLPFAGAHEHAGGALPFKPAAPFPAPPPAAAASETMVPPRPAPRAGGITLLDPEELTQPPVAPFALAAPGTRAPAPSVPLPGAPWGPKIAEAPPLPFDGETSTLDLGRSALDELRRLQGPAPAPPALVAPPMLVEVDDEPTPQPPAAADPPRPLMTPAALPPPPPLMTPAALPPPPPLMTLVALPPPPPLMTLAALPPPPPLMTLAAAPPPPPPPPPPLMTPSPPPPPPAPSPPTEPPAAPAAPAAPEVPSSPLRDKVLAALAAGESVRGLDLTGADLRGLDFRKAALDGARLAGANLRRSNLTGARLADAQLVGADLGEAVLDGADLTRADLSRAVLAGTSFAGANLTDTNLSSARGPGAIFTGATVRRATFARGAWEGAVFDGLDGVAVDFTEAALDRARFEGAKLAELRLDDAHGEGAVFDGATMPEAHAEGASLVKSSLQRIEAPGSVWERATLDGSRFDGANLRGGNLVGASCAGASFKDVHAEEANLTRLTGDGADLGGAVLEGADLRQARLQGAIFDGANLRGVAANKVDLSRAQLVRADLSGAVLRAGKLTGANLAHATLESADLRDADLERANVFGASRKTAKLNGANVKDLVEADPEG